MTLGVDDLDSIATALVDRGLILDRQTTPRGQHLGSISDPDGNLIVFAQDLVARDPGAADMLVIAGYLVVDPDERDEYLAQSKAVMTAASAAPGCLDFSMTADALDPSRIRIFERWASKEQLLGFRGSGPSDEQSAAIRDAKVERYTIAAVGDP